MAKKQTKKLSYQFYKQVQTVCKHFHKPEKIADLPLAYVALRVALVMQPYHPTDRDGRFKALHHAVNESFKPLEDLSRTNRDSDIYICLYCYTYRCDPAPDKTNAPSITSVAEYVQINYGISTANFPLLRDDGVQRLGDQLGIYFAQHTMFIEPTPTAKHFIGRTKEIAYYRALLDTNSLAVIQGGAGVGKTALAAHIAQSIQTEGRPICWLTIRAGLNNSFIAIVYTWATFLAQHHEPHAWALMHISPETRQSHHAPLSRTPQEILHNQLSTIVCTGFRKVKPLLCLDNVDAVPETDTEFWSLFDKVCCEEEVGILACTRSPLPAHYTTPISPILTGLNEDEVEAFLLSRGIEMVPTLHTHVKNTQQIWHYTAGNPRLLELWVSYMQVLPAGASVAESFGHVPEQASVANHVAKAIMTALPPSQARAAHILSLSRRPIDSVLLLDPPDDIPVPLEDVGIEPNNFVQLYAQGYIVEWPNHQWSLAPLLASYLQTSGDAPVVTSLHACLAGMFLVTGDFIESAYHQIRAKDTHGAVLLLAEQQDVLINQGQAFAMLELLTSIDPPTTIEPVRQLLSLLKGELLLLLGHYAEAQVEAEAIQQTDSTPWEKASAQQWLGEVDAQQGHMQQATAHYTQALELLTLHHIALQPWLLHDLAWNHLNEDHLDLAWGNIKQAEIALDNARGEIVRKQGQYERALHYFDCAIAAAQASGYDYLMANALNNRGRVYDEMGHYERAIDDYTTYLEIVRTVGDPSGEAVALNNIGICFFMLQQYTQAIDYEYKALDIATRIGDSNTQIITHSNLAEAYLAIGDIAQARLHGEQAIAHGQVGPAMSYAEALRVYAEVLLAQGAYQEALQQATQAKALFPPGNMTEPYLRTYLYKTLMRIYDALGDGAQAHIYRMHIETLAAVP